MPISTKTGPLTYHQEVQLRDDLVGIEKKLLSIAVLMRAAHDDDSRVVIRADETLCALQRFKWELERAQMKTSAAAG